LRVDFRLGSGIRSVARKTNEHSDGTLSSRHPSKVGNDDFSALGESGNMADLFAHKPQPIGCVC
jgi:hypothetical protein